MASKIFGLRPDQIRALAEGHGRCVATDRIVVECAPVGYMYREEPQDPDDSGWCFFAGDESEEYTNDPARLGIYDVNTIANYDPEIVSLLSEKPGAAFIRDARTGRLVMDRNPSWQSS